jgi:hypothetical protein
MALSAVSCTELQMGSGTNEEKVAQHKGCMPVQALQEEGKETPWLAAVKDVPYSPAEARTQLGDLKPADQVKVQKHGGVSKGSGLLPLPLEYSGP